MKSLFTDEVKDLPPEPPKSVVVKIRNGQEVVVDLKERKKCKLH
jgi:hypothetical protein